MPNLRYRFMNWNGAHGTLIPGIGPTSPLPPLSFLEPLFEDRFAPDLRAHLLEPAPVTMMSLGEAFVRGRRPGQMSPKTGVQFLRMPHMTGPPTPMDVLEAALSGSVQFGI